MPKDKFKDQRPKVKPPQIGLAALRKSHGMKQVEVAAAIEAMIDEPFYSGSLSLIEGGHRGASAEVLRALERIFRLDDGDLTVDYDPSHSRRKGDAA